MTTIRVMTYNVQHCRGGDGCVDLGRIAEVIAEGAPDLVALQEIDAGSDDDQLATLAKRLGMRHYGLPRRGANAFLSYYPLRGIQEYDLGDGGACLRGDADLAGKRLHLFNLRLAPHLGGRRQQIAKLLGPDVLGAASVGGPTLVMGDFADLILGAGNFHLTLVLRKARRPLWNATYPSCFPVLGRDRAYLRGELRVVDSSILRSAKVRQASSHLPLILTIQITDPRSYLRVEQLTTGRMKTAPG
ncbi:MAG: endonuclease/exonuclease/phosphatase family protein [Desulfuromonadales bacterium]|nr:endonuclease/exonuclease/phosphatase family protein [Desulfuromonadales bacterium]